MVNPQARTTQKAVIAALDGLGDADIPAGLAKAAKILRDAGIAADAEPASAHEHVSRALRSGGHNRMEKGGQDRRE